MLDASEAHRGRNFPSLLGSQPIHLIFSESTSFSGSSMVNITLGSRETVFFTRSDKTLIVLDRNRGLETTQHSL